MFDQKVKELVNFGISPVSEIFEAHLKMYKKTAK